MTPLKLTVVCHEERYLSTHFGNGGWKNETAEMQTHKTLKMQKSLTIDISC